jgi:hypothetical protein
LSERYNKESNNKDYANVDKTENLLVESIVIDDVFRVREREYQDTIDDYTYEFAEYKLKQAEGVKDAKYPFPPVRVWQRDGKYVLIAGFHRVAAAKQAGMESIFVSEFSGTEDEAFEIAIRDNSKHGLRLSRGDLKVCIEKAFRRNSNMSLTLVAEMTGASRSWCQKIKEELEQLSGNENLFPDKTLGKDGKYRSAKRAKLKPKESSTQVEAVVLSLPLPLEPDELVEHEPTVGVPQEPAIAMPQAPDVVVPQKPDDFVAEVSSQTVDSDDEFEFILWDRLERVSPQDQILRYFHAFETFYAKLDIENKKHFYEKLKRWIGKINTDHIT